MPMRISVPRLGLSAGKPIPRNDNVASSKIAEARSTVIITRSGPKMFGKNMHKHHAQRMLPHHDRGLDIFLVHLHKGRCPRRTGKIHPKR